MKAYNVKINLTKFDLERVNEWQRLINMGSEDMENKVWLEKYYSLCGELAALIVRNAVEQIPPWEPEA